MGTTLRISNASALILPGPEGTRIDLTGVSFVLPGGIVSLACAAKAAHARGEDVDLIPPESDDVARYAARMGFGDVLADCGVRSPLPTVTRHDRDDVLVECRWADDAAIGGVSELVNERLWDAEVDPEMTDLVTMAVYEVADNVRTHAASGGGFVCAQTYERGTPQERVEVAIGDIGQGIRASLEQRHAPQTDQEALRLAISESVSGLSPRRGLGLHYVARDIPRAGGRLTIRSGEGCLRVTRGGPFSTSCAPATGTLVGIQVPVGRMGRRGAADDDD